jgi:hypothetical protein
MSSPLKTIAVNTRMFWPNFNFRLFLSAAALGMLLIGPPLYAQVYSGSLTGVVTDPSGAVIAGAKVMVTDAGKGFLYRASTDDSGRYLVRPLPPSTYQLTVEAAGFKRHVQDSLVLNVNQSARVDVSLALGTDTEVVEVYSSATALATQDAVTGQELTRTFVNDLPLLGRGVFDLAGLAPGITQVQGGFAIANYANNFISNGSRNATSDILLDGVSTTNYEAGSGIQVPLITPSVDSVQEFKVQQSNFSADTGFSGSTVINVVSRSGTNEIHGSGYWFLRNNALTANNWFANAHDTKMAARRYNDFGGTVGGPIKKNKLFYFVDIEGLRDVNSTTYQAGVPSAQMRAGDFREICSAGFSAAGACNDPNGQLWDPYSGVYVPQLGGPYRTTYIPFNNLATYMSPGSPVLTAMGRGLPNRPGNLIDPVAAKLMSYYPLPNVNVGQASYNRYDNWISSGANVQTGYQGGIKIDHAISDNSRTSFKYSRQAGQVVGANPYGNVYNPTFTGPAMVHNQLVSLNHNRSFGPRTLLTLSLGFVRDYQHQQDVSSNYPSSDAVTDLGLPEYMRRSGFRASPAIAVSGYASPMGISIGSLPYAEMQQGSETWDLSPSVSRIQGSHDLKIGAQARMHRINFVQPGAPGGIYPYYVNGTSQFPLWGGGDSFASLLTGIGVPLGPNGQYDIPVFVSTQNFGYGGYLQDNWRITERLTLNLGLRYEVETPRTERHNRQTYIDLNAASPLQVPGFPNLKGALGFVDDSNRSPYGWDRNNWAPRLGFAYRLGDKTVMRGGYGIFYAATMRGAAGSSGVLGFSRRTNWIVSWDGQTPWARLSDPYPITGPLLPEGSKLGAMSFVGDSISGPMRQMLNATPYEQSWSFGLQREAPGGIVLDANYVGKKGTKLYFAGSGEFNHLGSEIESYSAAQIADLVSYVANPFAAVVPAGTPLSASVVQKYRLMLPYPQFASVDSTPLPVADSIYHSLQLRAEKRFSHGLQFLATYTVSKSIDDASAGAVTWMGGSASLQDPNNRSLERSLSQFDIPQLFVLSYVYDLPLGRNKALGRSWNPIVSAVLGGWKTNGIWRFSAGQPLALYMDGSTPLPTYGAQRPNLTGTLVRNTGADWLTHYFANPEVVSVAAPYTLGTAPRTLSSVRVPGVNSSNLSLFKYFELEKLRPGARVEFRSEFFNAFNHPQFCGPVSTVNNAMFGQVTSTCTAPREVQMALKFQW